MADTYITSLQPGRMAILGLFFARCPFHIPGLVMTVVVDALNCVERSWHAANVGNEGCKRIFPLRAHADPPAAIPCVMSSLWIATSRAHCLPDSIFALLGRVMKFIRFALQTTAASAFAAREKLGGHFAFYSAAASAKIVRADFIAISAPLNHSPICKLHPCEVAGFKIFRHALFYREKI